MQVGQGRMDRRGLPSLVGVCHMLASFRLQPTSFLPTRQANFGSDSAWLPSFRDMAVSRETVLSETPTPSVTVVVASQLHHCRRIQELGQASGGEGPRQLYMSALCYVSLWRHTKHSTGGTSLQTAFHTSKPRPNLFVSTIEAQDNPECIHFIIRGQSK
ncbi:hypothetical protein LY78DRAFT_366170 [Colletotrichum sublineola]|nr:hypothetical protein LY78DRAFT_366170 [Colletotrichum sublineola]